MSEMTGVTCLIADDHPAVLRSLSQLVTDWGITVVGSADNGAEALRKIRELRPMVALVDLRLPGVSGTEIVREITRHLPETTVVAYTGHDDRGLVHEVLDAGARGFVLKDAPLEDLRRALLTVAAGGTYIDPVAGGRLIADASATALTERERETLRLLAAGCSNAEIGAKLFISPETVRAHIRKAARKLGARTRTEAVAAALRSGLIK